MISDKNKTISIVVPIYNVKDYLNRCIESIVNQTYSILEIVLVDDGSTDGCSQLCDDWAKKDSRIIIIHQENQGLSAARNRGLISSSGEYVLYVDADDYLETDACEGLFERINNSGCDFIVGNVREIKEDGVSKHILGHSRFEDGVILSNKEFIIKSIISDEWYAPAFFNMYNRDFLIRSDLFFKKGRLFEDVEMLPRLYLKADSIMYADFAFYNYGFRRNSIMNSPIDKRKVDSAIANFADWKRLIDEIKDAELKRVMYGALVKYYLYMCRLLRIKSWAVEGVDYRFAFRYSLKFKERVKVILFGLCPSIYCKIGVG